MAVNRMIFVLMRSCIYSKRSQDLIGPMGIGHLVYCGQMCEGREPAWREYIPLLGMCGFSIHTYMLLVNRQG